jgi:hypothetical protein
MHSLPCSRETQILAMCDDVLPAAASATSPIAVNVVERAFASVRLVEANVRVGGAWLTLQTVSELIVGEAGDPHLGGSPVMGLSSLVDTVCVCARTVSVYLAARSSSV